MLKQHFTQSEGDGLASRSQSVPGLDPGRGLFRAKSPSTVAGVESAAPAQASSPARMPLKVPERFKSPEAPLKMTANLKRLEPSQVQTTEAACCEHGNNGNVAKSISNGSVDPLKANTSQMDRTGDQRMARKTEASGVPLVTKKDDEAMVQTQNLTKMPEGAKIIAEPVKSVPGLRTSQLPTARMAPVFCFKHDIIKTENKADVSRGLTRFMVGNKRRKDKEQQLEQVDKGKPPEEKKKSELLETKQECIEGTTTQVLQDTDRISDLKEASSAPIVGLPQTSSKITSKLSLPSVLDFVPPLKSTPVTSYPNVTSAATSTTPCSPPACKSSCLPLSHSVLGSNPSLAGGSIPHPSPAPPSPPSGNIPVQQAAVSQEEVQWSRATSV
ncbi:uncharacterized protein FYW61_000905 [Anableps anableps]